MSKPTTPRAARTTVAIRRLSHDNVMQGEYSIMISEDVVWFSEQAFGEKPRQPFTIPREAFDAFVDWYETGKVPRSDKAARTPPREVPA